MLEKLIGMFLKKPKYEKNPKLIRCKICKKLKWTRYKDVCRACYQRNWRKRVMKNEAMEKIAMGKK